MKEHEKISSERLKKDVLKEAGKTHKLTKCPLCGGNVSEATCHSGVRIGYIDYVRSFGNSQERRSYGCDHCGIIWVLEMFNSVEEKCSGAIEEHEHHLSLLGKWNCYCQFIAVEWVHFHHGKEHSHIDFSNTVNCAAG